MRGDGRMKHLRQFLIILLFSFLTYFLVRYLKSNLSYELINQNYLNFDYYVHIYVYFLSKKFFFIPFLILCSMNYTL